MHKKSQVVRCKDGGPVQPKSTSARKGKEDRIYNRTSHLSSKPPAHAVGADAANAKKELTELIGERAAGPANRVSAKYAAKVLTDLGLFAVSPYEMMKEALEQLGNPVAFKIEIDKVRLHERVTLWLNKTHVGYKTSGKYLTIKSLPYDFMVPDLSYPIEKTIELLELFNVQRSNEGIYTMASFTIDIKNRYINNKFVMPTALSFGPIGGSAEIDSDTLMYIIVSLMIREAYGSAEGAARAVRELLEGMERCFDSPKVGDADEARKRIEHSKPALLQLIFDQYGFGILPEIKMDAATTYKKVSDEIPGMGSHPQGTYMVRFEDVGIDLQAAPAMDDEMSRMNQLMLHMRRRALVGSVDVTKWFKRLVLALAQQARLVKPDTGFMTSNGAHHTGKRTPVLIVKGGIPLPYLGISPALDSRRVLGQHFAHYSEDIVEETWTGMHAVSGPELGTLVKAGDMIAEAGANQILARRDGILLDRRGTPRDGETTVIVKVGDADYDGQLKPRTVGGGKESVGYLHFTGAKDHWVEILKAVGIEVNEGEFINGGDTAIIGLKDGYKPLYARGEDSNKAVGKGAAMGRVALMAETMERKVDYTTKADHEGKYNPLVKEFEEKYLVDIIQPWSVDPETFAAVQRTVAKKGAHSGVTLHKVDYAGKLWHIVVQRTQAYQAYDLVKVESLPVADCLTTQRVQGEIVTGLNVVGQHEAAMAILSGGKSQLQEYRRLHEICWNFPIWADTNRGVYTTPSGRNVPIVTINLAEVHGGQATIDKFLQLGSSRENMSKLDKPIAVGYWDEKATYSDCAVIIDPMVLKTFGGGKDKSSCEMLSRMLFMAIGTEGSTKVQVQRLIRRLRGVMQKLAKAPAVAKRVQRGSSAVQMRTRAGFMPSGWAAVSYYGDAACKLARELGWTRESGVRPGEFIAGQMYVMFRSPQFNSTPQRLFCPDAPQEVIDRWKAEGKFPKEMGKYTDGRMEPSTAYISPLATANDHGDHDGDGRVFVVITDPTAIAKLEAWDWRRFRLAVLEFSFGLDNDPVVKAYEHDPKKMQWGQVKVTTLGELVGITHRSITNQTLHIGSAYNHAHAALTTADLYGSQDMAIKAFGLMVGHYEEQLAGLSETYYKFYEDMKNWQKPEVFDRLQQLNKELGHTKADFDTFFRVHGWLAAAMSFKFGKRELPSFAVKGDQPDWLAVTVIYSIAVYRAMSSGNLGDRLIRELADNQTENAQYVRAVLQQLRSRSVVAEQIMLMLEIVMPELPASVFPTYDEYDFEV